MAAKVSSSNERPLRTPEQIAEGKRQELAGDLLRRSGVDKRHLDRVFADLAKHSGWLAGYEKAIDKVGERGIVILIGDRGNGKTQCAAEIIKYYCVAGNYCKYIRARELNNVLLDSQVDNERCRAVQGFVTPFLLVIDEFQERFPTDFGFRNMSLILDKRYGSMKPTIIIANCTEAAILDILGPSVVDRAKEGGGLLVFSWKSFR